MRGAGLLPGPTHAQALPLRLQPPPGRHPREEGRLREAFDLWLRRYEEACHAYATCRYLETLGPGRQLREARAVVDEHDRTSRADSGLPLA